MSRPPKPYAVLKSEGKSHRTNKEMAMRKNGEEEFNTSATLNEREEVKNNIVAHNEFVRIVSLLDGIKKNDALYEPIINRYCIIQAECIEFAKQRERMYEAVEHLEKAVGCSDISDSDLIRTTSDIAKICTTAINIDKQIQTKRKMLLDIEKECVMTIASALRNVQRKDDKKENPLLKALGGD